MENPDMKFKEALIWMKANCTARDCKQKLLEKMDTITMKSGERIQVFLTRATALRVKLLDAGIETDNFHFRSKIEAALMPFFPCFPSPCWIS